MEALRFFIVAICGVIIDLSIAYMLAEALSLPLWLAATTGFVLAAVGNYALHELWTFRGGTRRLSRRRAFQYLAASVVTLASRLAAVLVLQGSQIVEGTLVTLVVGAAFSFVVNFLLSKFLIFTNPTGSAPR